MAIEQITVSSSLPPGGHYSQATAFHDLVFVSGQLPITGEGPSEPECFEAQARTALGHLLAIVQASGSSADHVLKVTAYIVGIEHWPLFNRVFAEMFGNARPARAVVPVPELHYGYLVEVDAIAARQVPVSSNPSPAEAADNSLLASSSV